MVKQERDRLLALAQAQSTTRKLIAFLKYKLVKNRLLAQRDRFIAGQIAQTLPENQTGLLFVGAYHVILPQMPADIQVREVKAIQKVSAYQQLLPFYRTHKEQFEELGRYLMAPIEA